VSIDASPLGGIHGNVKPMKDRTAKAAPDAACQDRSALAGGGM